MNFENCHFGRESTNLHSTHSTLSKSIESLRILIRLSCSHISGVSSDNIGLVVIGFTGKSLVRSRYAYFAFTLLSIEVPRYPRTCAAMTQC